MGQSYQGWKRHARVRKSSTQTSGTSGGGPLVTVNMACATRADTTTAHHRAFGEALPLAVCHTRFKQRGRRKIPQERALGTLTQGHLKACGSSSRHSLATQLFPEPPKRSSGCRSHAAPLQFESSGHQNRDLLEDRKPRHSWLYLDNRSERHGAPVLI